MKDAMIIEIFFDNWQEILNIRSEHSDEN